MHPARIGLRSIIFDGRLFHRIIKVLRYMHRTPVIEEDSERSPHCIPYSHPQLPTHGTHHPQHAYPHPPQQDRSLLDLADLFHAKERFKTFIEEMGRLKYSPIRADITAYCGMQKKSQKNTEKHIRPQSLLKKIDTRIDKMIKTKRIKRNWGEGDLTILTWIVSKFTERKNYTDLERDITHEDWIYIASLIPGVTAEACMFKWLSMKKVTLATHNWTKGESEILSAIVRERIEKNMAYQGQIKDWKEISQELYQLNQQEDKVYRNAKQCREHWTCYLSPHLKKGPWQLYQDLKLLKFIKDNDGLKKWSEIARHFEGRTENALKNRYTLIIEKQKKQVKNRNKTELQLISQFLQKSYVDQFTINVKTQADSIIEDNSSIKMQVGEVTPLMAAKPKKEEFCLDTNQTTITPLRVQKFNLHDFETMNIHFFKNIQPGIINPNGTFKKIANPGSIRELVLQLKKQENGEAKAESGPFIFTSIHKIAQESSS